MQFTGTYASLKDMVDYLADQTGRMTLDNVNASFDSSTGNLSGSITVNLFFMAGTGQTQNRRLPTPALTARQQTVRKEQTRRTQPLLRRLDRRNRESMLEGREIRAPLTVFL